MGTSNSQVLLCKNKMKSQPPASSIDEGFYLNYTLHRQKLFGISPKPSFICTMRLAGLSVKDSFNKYLLHIISWSGTMLVTESTMTMSVCWTSQKEEGRFLLYKRKSATRETTALDVSGKLIEETAQPPNLAKSSPK